MMRQIAESSPSAKARIAGGFYLITILGGVLALFVHGRLGSIADVIAGVSYMAVTVLFYYVFKPVSASISLLAALFSVMGFVTGRLGLQPHGVEVSMVCFGLYCILIGYLILRSTFLPRSLGVVMIFAGSAWLTVLSPPLSNYLKPYNLAVGGLAELSLCLWLLVMGLNDSRWRAQQENHDHVRPRTLVSPVAKQEKV